MEIIIEEYTKDRINDVVEFENRLREKEEWGWEIDENYLASVRKSFDDPTFRDSISLLAYVDGKVVGRIDSSMISSYFDGITRAYLDWICVLMDYRHKGVGQALMQALRDRLKERNIDTLVAITASNEEAQRFYKSIGDSRMHDTAIWIDIKEKDKI